MHYKITAREHKDISKFQNVLYTASIFTTKRVPQRTSCETFKNTVPTTKTEKTIT